MATNTCTSPPAVATDAFRFFVPFAPAISKIVWPHLFHLARETYTLRQIIKSWIEMQGLKFRCHVEEDQAAFTMLIPVF
jgi:hypothetical protein